MAGITEFEAAIGCYMAIMIMVAAPASLYFVQEKKPLGKCLSPRGEATLGIMIAIVWPALILVAAVVLVKHAFLGVREVAAVARGRSSRDAIPKARDVSGS